MTFREPTTVVNERLDRLGGVYVDPGDLSFRYTTDYERGASGVWTLNTSSASLTAAYSDPDDVPVLTPLGTAPSYSSSHVILATDGMFGLATPFPDSYSFTVMGVSKRPASGDALFAGTQSPVQTSGWLVYASGSVLGGLAFMGTAQMSLNMGWGAIAAGNDFLWCLSLQHNRVVFYIHGAAAQTQYATGPLIPQSDGNLIAIGDGYSSSTTFDDTTSHARFCYWDRGMTANEIGDVAAREVARMAALAAPVTVVPWA